MLGFTVIWILVHMAEVHCLIRWWHSNHSIPSWLTLPSPNSRSSLILCGCQLVYVYGKIIKIWPPCSHCWSCLVTASSCASQELYVCELTETEKKTLLCLAARGSSVLCKWAHLHKEVSHVQSDFGGRQFRTVKPSDCWLFPLCQTPKTTLAVPKTLQMLLL